MSENTVKAISSKLWDIANDLRGNMDANSFKDYILSFLFYKYLSSHQEAYIMDNWGYDESSGLSVNDFYKEQVEAEGLTTCLEDIAGSLGYAINPEDTWASLIDSIHRGLLEPKDFQRIFINFNESRAFLINFW